MLVYHKYKCDWRADRIIKVVFLVFSVIVLPPLPVARIVRHVAQNVGVISATEYAVRVLAIVDTTTAQEVSYFIWFGLDSSYAELQPRSLRNVTRCRTVMTRSHVIASIATHAKSGLQGGPCSTIVICYWCILIA
jgi:hypothetical protein